MPEQPEQSLEHQLKMARPRRGEVKRVPLSEKEKEFLGKIMNKAVAAEKAGELAEALGFYTDYKNEFSRIKESLSQKERRKENIWKFVIKQIIYYNFIEVYVFKFMRERYKSVMELSGDEVWQDKIKKIEGFIEGSKARTEYISDLKCLDLLLFKYGVIQYDPLEIFDISDEEIERCYSIMDPFRSSPSDILKSREWQLKPEIKKEIEEILRNDKQARDYVEKTYKHEIEAEKKSK